MSCRCTEAPSYPFLDSLEQMRAWSYSNYKENFGESSNLLEDLKSMVNNPDFSDVTFDCQDGVKIHACRMFLAARSSVFRALLLNGMAESKNTFITLPTVASSPLVKVLGYLYTGTCFRREDNTFNLERFLSYNWELVMDVVVASRFLLLEQLEHMAVKRLWFDLPPGNALYPVDTLNKIALGLSTLCAYPTVFREGKTAMFLQVVRFRVLRLLTSHDIPYVTLSKLSKDAFRYYLANMQEQDGFCKWSIEEYRKLIHLLAWCASDLNDTEKHQCLLSAERAARFLADGNEVKLFPIDSGGHSLRRSREKFLHSVATTELNDLLPLVDLTSIDSELLLHIVKPLNLIDSQMLENVLGDVLDSRLRKPFRASFQGRRLNEGSGNSISCNSFIKPKPLFVDVANPVHPHETFKWSVISQFKRPENTQPDDLSHFLEIGFLCLSYGEVLSREETTIRLSQNHRGWAIILSDNQHLALFYPGQSLLRGCDRHAYSGVKKKSLWSLPRIRGKKFKLNSTIEVAVSRKDNTIAFSYNGRSKLFEVQDVPGCILYPAVSLGGQALQVTMKSSERFDPRLNSVVER